MELKIGEIREFNGEWYQCVEGNDCANCVFNDYCKSHTKEERDDTIGLCVSFERSDGTNVIFKKLEKFGSPFSCNYYGDSRLVMMQEYQLFDGNVTYCYSMPQMFVTDIKHKRIAIEIKVNKEDMKEKDIKPYDKNISEGTVSNTENLVTSSLKPFDLEAAKAGKPVCTRDGQKTRIICFDKKEGFPIVALVETRVNDRVSEEVALFNINGRAVSDDIDSKLDLMMSPEKKEGWANVYKDSVCDSKEEALNRRSKIRGYIDTVKVSWEE